MLGDPDPSSSDVPIPVTGLGSRVRGITAGAHHACALTQPGAVKCWGSNEFGQLGDGTTWRETPVAVAGLSSGVTAVSLGVSHSCTVLTSGVLKCWGANNNGELGDGTRTNRLTPTRVVGLAGGVASVGAGSYHTCAATTRARRSAGARTTTARSATAPEPGAWRR